MEEFKNQRPIQDTGKSPEGKVDTEPDLITKIEVVRKDGEVREYRFIEKFVSPGRAYSNAEREKIANKVFDEGLFEGGFKEVRLHTEPTSEQKTQLQKGRGMDVYTREYKQ